VKRNPKAEPEDRKMEDRKIRREEAERFGGRKMERNLTFVFSIFLPPNFPAFYFPVFNVPVSLFKAASGALPFRPSAFSPS
jgi:hypothetical protein